jgi:hypothetical protein
VPALPWGLLGVATVPLGILAVVTYLRIHPPVLFGDASYYASALPALTGDAPLYDPASFAPHTLPPPPFWDQAPSTAMFVLPLLLPAGHVVWGLLMAACVVAGILVLMPRLGAGVFLFAPVVMALPPVLEGLVWANLSSLVFLCFAVAWRWPRWAGWAIGIAAAAKVMPILAVAWLVGRRDWRGTQVALAVPAALTALAIVLTSPTVLVDFVVVRLNQEPMPGVVRWGLSDAGVPEVVTWVAGLVVAILAGWRASFSLAVLAVLLVAPALHMHYLLIPLVPVIGIWIPSLIGRGRGGESAEAPDHRAIRAVRART